MLLAAGGTFLDQPQLMAVRPLVTAAGATEAFRPARPEQVVATLRIAAEARQKAPQVVRQARQQIVVHPASGVVFLLCSFYPPAPAGQAS